MAHGSLEYFRERARFERRLSLVLAIVSCTWLGCQSVLLLPIVRNSMVARFLESGPLEPRRYGFEGPETYVQRIILETSGPPGPIPGRPTIYYRSLRAVKGGRAATKGSTDPHAIPDVRPLGFGPGESVEDLVARARVLYGGSAPVVRTEDLVIERAVPIRYPEAAVDLNLEGRLVLVALVDTTGVVAKVEVMSSTGQMQLDEAASAALRQWRFRPYMRQGRLREVNVVVPVRFRIY